MKIWRQVTVPEKAFSYVGKKQDGSTVKGSVFASSEAQAMRKIAGMGFEVQSLRPTDECDAESVEICTLPEKNNTSNEMVALAGASAPSTGLEDHEKARQRLFFGQYEAIKREVDEILAQGGKIIHICMHPDLQGRIKLAIVINESRFMDDRTNGETR